MEAKGGAEGGGGGGPRRNKQLVCFKASESLIDIMSLKKPKSLR